MKLTYDEVRECYRKIASGERRHSSFLTHFAEAVIRADPDNFSTLYPVAVRLIHKYELYDYVHAVTERNEK